MHPLFKRVQTRHYVHILNNIISATIRTYFTYYFNLHCKYYAHTMVVIREFLDIINITNYHIQCSCPVFDVKSNLI